MDLLIAGVVGFLVAFIFALVVFRPRLTSAETDAKAARDECHAAQTECARLNERLESLPRIQAELERANQLAESRTEEIRHLESQVAAFTASEAEREKAHAAQIQTLREAQEEMRNAFAALSQEALGKTTQSLVEQCNVILDKYKEVAEGESRQRQRSIEATLTPFKERLEGLEKLSRELDQKREKDASAITEHVRTLADLHQQMQKETTRLVKSLQNPGQAGAWGEMVLEQVLELGGLKKNVNYRLQVHEGHSEGGTQRPDAVIELPGARQIAIDSKAPMTDFLEAHNDGIEPHDKARLLSAFAHKLFEHCRRLSQRRYAEGESRFDLTILFVPSEGAYRALLESRPTIMEDALSIQIILASPTTLLGFVRAVAQGWRQEETRKSTDEIIKQASDLYESLGIMADKLEKLGKSLSAAEGRYNDTLSTFNGTLLPRARRFNQMGVQGKRSQAIETVEEVHVHLNAPALEALNLPKEAGVLPLFEDDFFPEEEATSD
jgi:DNA recombination protein RmuC